MNTKVSIKENSNVYLSPSKGKQIKTTWVGVSIIIDDIIYETTSGYSRLDPDDEYSHKTGYVIARSRALIKACKHSLKKLDKLEKYYSARLEQIKTSKDKLTKLSEARINILKEYNLKH